MSFFREEVLELSSSRHNARLEVWYAWGRVVVNAANVNLSGGSLHEVFRSVFRQLGVARQPWRDVLLLGLGGGSVPQLLAEMPGERRVTGVEIDGEMIRLARKWCGLDEIPGLRVVEGDAVAYVAGCDERFDLVIVDLFVDLDVPEGAEAADFLRNAAALVRPGGRLLFNRLMHTPAVRELSLEFTRTMQEVLPGTTWLNAHTNRVLVYAP